MNNPALASSIFGSPHGLQSIVRVHERVYNIVHDHEPSGRSSVLGVGVPGIEQNCHVMIPETEAREEHWSIFFFACKMDDSQAPAFKPLIMLSKCLKGAWSCRQEILCDMLLFSLPRVLFSDTIIKHLRCHFRKGINDVKMKCTMQWESFSLSTTSTINYVLLELLHATKNSLTSVGRWAAASSVRWRQCRRARGPWRGRTWGSRTRSPCRAR